MAVYTQEGAWEVGKGIVGGIVALLYIVKKSS